MSKNGVERIADERDRQVALEGFTHAHDDGHARGELTAAAAAYLRELQVRGPAHMTGVDPDRYVPIEWPWPREQFKPKADPVRQLEIVGAFVAAEIDRLLRERGDL